MGMYMYKTEVPESKVFIEEDKSYSIEDCRITLDILKQFNIGENDYFSINNEDMLLDVTYRRLETDDEFNIRIKKAIDYNKRYDEFQDKIQNCKHVYINNYICTACGKKLKQSEIR